jgi:hypothetical protein
VVWDPPWITGNWFDLVMDGNKSGRDLPSYEAILGQDLSRVMRLHGNPRSTYFNELIGYVSSTSHSQYVAKCK